MLALRLITVLVSCYSIWGVGRVEIQTVREGRLLYTEIDQHGYNIGRSDCVIFSVKACESAHIGLMENSNKTTPRYEIVLGGWGNSKSIIVKYLLNSPRIHKTAVDEGNIISCSEFRSFKISWENGRIVVYRRDLPNTWKEFMKWTDYEPHPVRSIGVSTFDHAIGDWVIENEECQEIMPWTLAKWKKDSHNINTMFANPRFTMNECRSQLQCINNCQQYSDCRYVTYNANSGSCKGFSQISTPSSSDGDVLWIKQ